MAEESWVFDSLVGFLRGPVWNVPILTFIEHKSLIFEPGCQYDESHSKIHEEYKNLVDFMIGSYMEDIGIAPEQFESACGKASTNIKTQFHQALFEQVWAADDYAIFKPMMCQKNLELQLQALELLQHRYGIIPESCTPGDNNKTKDEQEMFEQVIKAPNDPALDSTSLGDQDESQILELILKKSIQEHEALRDTLDSETRELERAIVDSKTERDRLEAQCQREKDSIDQALKLSLNSDSPPSTKSTLATPLPSLSSIDPDELLRRQEYLKQQRDKLLALKQQEREKQLQKFEDAAPQKRPKSSRAARRVLRGSNIDAQTLQVRKALMERLKAEVVDDQ